MDGWLLLYLFLERFFFFLSKNGGNSPVVSGSMGSVEGKGQEGSQGLLPSLFPVNQWLIHKSQQLCFWFDLSGRVT